MSGNPLAWAALLAAPVLAAGEIVTLSGAKGDGVANDTAIIQKAIDALPEKGTLIIPPGQYRCGGLKLKSRMTLRLAAGAELIGSGNIDDYIYWGNLQRTAYGLGWAMLYGHNIEDVTIEGPGTVNGSGHLFWAYDGERLGDKFDQLTDGWKVYRPNKKRPVPILMHSCRNVVLRDFLIVNSPAFTVWTIG